MKKLFAISNAHIDPVWLWEWQEGATATIATFRAAADFCDEYDGYIFCHNEALLYQWTEEYDPALFARIQELVEAGKWHIMGGWFLQPDCNIPSGESILRQILTGRRYFLEKFGKKPTTALNFDTFGHSRGMVQILSQCGYDSYVFMRPNKTQMNLPATNFTWTGYDGSTVVGHRLTGSYGNNYGEVVNRAKQCIQENTEDAADILAWGVGNHGGGPSRADINELNALMDASRDVEIRHSTPEEFFAYLKETKVECPDFAEDIRPVFVGCYVSQARLKKMHRQLENALYSAEKMAAAASSLGLMEFPAEELEQAQWDMLLNEFHDTLPGTTIESAALAAQKSVSHGLEIADRVKMRAFMALLSGQEKAKPEWTPIFIYNPHPYPVCGVFKCEFMPAQHQNWRLDEQYTVDVYHEGRLIESQLEKPECNMNFDWRLCVVFHATLEPFAMNRFDCEVRLEKKDFARAQFPPENIHFTNGSMEVVINRKTGLVDRYCVDGVDYLKAGSFETRLYKDNPDPWNMLTFNYPDQKGAFAPTAPKCGHEHSYEAGAPEIMVPAVRIVEDGSVCTVVEAEFRYNDSRLIQTYRLPKKGSSFEVEQRLYWNETDTIAKVVVPCSNAGDYIGQTMFGSGKLPQDGTECVSQKWCGIFGRKHALTVANMATYGSHAEDDTMYLSIVRAPAYAAHPLDSRPIIREDRFIPRVDQGEHVFIFQICGGCVDERREKIEMEALVMNEAPFVRDAFPGGSGEKCGSFLSLSDGCVVMTAMNRSNQMGELMIRLFNPTGVVRSTEVNIPSLGVCETIQLPAFRFQTYLIRNGRLEASEPV